jgi:hypothetical protein
MYRKCWHCDREVLIKEKIINKQVVEIFVVHKILGVRCPASLTRVTDGEL